jgi:HEAT repeat protein
MVLVVCGCGRRGPHAPAPVEPPAAAAPLLTPTVAAPIAEARSAAGLNARDPLVRQQAIEALGRQGEKGFPDLLRGLHSHDPAIRLACLEVLSRPVIRAHQREVWPAMLGLLRERRPEARRAVLGRLDFFPDRRAEALTLLRQVASGDPDTAVRHFAVEILVSLSGQDPARLLSDPNPLVRQRAAQSLAASETPK